MIGFLLFIAAANLAVSIFLKTPTVNKYGDVDFTSYTKLSFKATAFFTLLYWFS